MNILKYIQTLIDPPLVMPDTTKVWGVDVSHWNPAPVDFQRMRDLYHLDFAIMKGADGAITARYFRENVASVKAAGIPWGMYVWLYPNNKVSIAAQVAAWRALEVELVPPLGLFIDCEWTTYNGAAANPLTSDLRLAHDKYFALSGTHATTYTAKGYADTYLKGFDWSREPLWIANYGVASPALPIGATTYQFWQFTSTLDGWTLDPSGNQKLDGNYWNGTHEQFAEQWGTSPLPPTGETMTLGTAREALGNIASVRNAPDVSGAKIGTIPGGSTVNFMELVNGSKVATDKWLKLPDGISYVNQNVAGKVYFTILTMPTTPPPVAEYLVSETIEPASGTVITKLYNTGRVEKITIP